MHCRYIFRIFRPSTYVKVIGSMSRSQEEDRIYERIKHAHTRGLFAFD